MWQKKELIYVEHNTAEVSEQEAVARVKALEQSRRDFKMPTGSSGHFDHYAQQVYHQVSFNERGATEVVFPKQPVPEERISSTATNIATLVSNDTASHENYCWQDGILWMIAFNGKPCKVANYYLTIAGAIQVIEAGGIENGFRITITTADKSFFYVIKKEELYDLGSQLIADHPECFVFPGRGEDFKTYIWLRVKEFLHQRESAPYKIYNLFGWYDDNGTLRFMHAGLKCSDFEVKCSLTLKQDLAKTRTFYNSFCQVAPQKVMVILLLYSLYSYMAGLYQRCCPDEGCRSVMYLAGTTGSGKTSLVKVITAWTKKAGLSTELRFDDTLASLQENLVNNRDIVSLVDDFYPKATKVAKIDFQRKAEEITRIIGDGRVKGKMGADRKPMPDRDYRGGIIATGEYVDLGTHSSYLRCFIVNIAKDDVLFEQLTSLQQSPELAQAFFSEWVLWLEEKQQSLFGKLPTWQQTNLHIVRSCLQSEYARLSVSIAALMTTADCFAKFAAEKGLIFENNQAKNIVLMQARQMYDTVKLIAPEQVAMKAIVEALENGSLNIQTHKEAFRNNPSADGYYDGSDKCWIVTTKVREIIKRFAECNNYSVEFTPMLRESLHQKGFMYSPNETKFSQSIPGRANKRPRGYTFIIKEEENNYEKY